MIGGPMDMVFMTQRFPEIPPTFISGKKFAMSGQKNVAFLLHFQDNHT